MSCDRWREAISARLDGEDPGLDVDLLDTHLARCAECRAFAAAAERSRRRIAPAPDLPDLAPRIRRGIAVADRARRPVIRAALGVVAAEILVVSLRSLVLAHEDGAGAHTARHLGAFTAAYGVGLLVVVARPARARAMLPVAAVLAGALVITAVVDVVEGRIPLVGEARHLPELASVVLVWLLAVPSGRRTSAGAGSHRLRAVGDDGRDVA